MQWNAQEENTLTRLDTSIAACIRRSIPLYQGILEEIRIRVNRPVILNVSGIHHPLELLCSHDMIQTTVQKLCGHSLYAHAETLRDGFICTEDGIRAGVCGRVVAEKGKITFLRDIHSICIRLPHRIPDAGKEIYHVLMHRQFTESVLVFSPPGYGKTTVLRELAAALSDPPMPVRVALVDTRYELGTGLENCLMLDILSGYPRSQGIEIALRTMSPDYIICDEISSPDDRQALLQCIGSGVRICTSIHAGTLSELQCHPVLQDIPNIFQWYYGIDRNHTGTLFPAHKE